VDQIPHQLPLTRGSPNVNPMAAGFSRPRLRAPEDGAADAALSEVTRDK